MLKTLLSVFLVFVIVTFSQAQSRLAYLDLLRSERQSQVYFEHTFHPSSDSLTEISVQFRLELDFLIFSKAKDNTYRADIKATLELYDSKMNIIQSRFWSGEKVVDSYEKTAARDEFLMGRMFTELPKGDYFYFLKFQGSNQKREISSEKVKFSIGSAKKPVWFYQAHSEQSEESQELINYGGNTVYGKDFDLYLTFPKNTFSAPKIKYDQISINEKDTTLIETKMEVNLNDEKLLNGFGFILDNPDNSHFVIKDGFPHLCTVKIPIPNRLYPNSGYRISFYDGDSLIQQKIFQSYWYDIPLSLLNLDVAISMLHFILPAGKSSQLFSGNEKEKLAKFTAFWNQKDPTPDTDFNELMYEYYKRIDSAFKDYSTPRNPGFETDMGKVFIVYGEPLKKEKTYPSTGFVRETWVYSNRTFTFQAGSGFGDFQLIK